MLTRTTAKNIRDYAKSINDDDNVGEMPPYNVLQGMSQILDASCERIFKDFTPSLSQSINIRRAVAVLTNGPRTCGGFKTEKGILGNLTPFEQSCALADWMKVSGPNIRKQHTFAFLSKDERGNEKVVPIWVKKPKKSPATLFTTIVGTTRGKLKAPPYQTWSETDPRHTPLSHFIDPLLYLEMQRQPLFLAASLLKANPYDRKMLDSEWRYKTKNADGTLAGEASVEHKKQHTRKVEELKQRSAAYNLCKMLAKDTFKKKNILPKLKYEDYFEENYDDDDIPTVTPFEICASISKAIDKDADTDPVDKLMKKLFATRLSSKSEIAIVQTYTQKALFKAREPLEDEV